ncbi:putative DNA-binding domain-containing protein [Sneathiella sp.]|uniref:HvfC/BufC family peptide modification chaperone n=1 Tax=Sneathiella sp. TaxID=1964365 RepID=UPI00356883EA
MWPDVQQEFAGVLLHPDRMQPDGIRAAPLRFDVYRNNVMVGLRRALEETFPVVRALVGDAFFAAMAQAFIRAHPPTSPVLLKYGAGFDVFIRNFEPAESLPYLADVARLEQAWLAAYHAADCVPLTIDALANIPEVDLDTLQLRPHPSLQMFAADHPAVSIWEAHQGPAPVDLRGLMSGRTYAMIVRPHLDVAVIQLQGPAFNLGATLFAGVPLSVALESADAEALDPSTVLFDLFAAGAVAGLGYGDNAIGDTPS